ncbi:MAG: BPSS1780 family membrane protein [Rhodocyclaceae bacterium]|nr:BPSS1780 family membrane protein [Rhodocyclaceae bacterium]
MQASTLPFSRGGAWLKEGFALWRRAPALLTFLSFAYLLALVVLSAVPLLGQVAASLCMPLLSLGILAGCQAVERGQKVGPEILFAGLRMNIRGLLAVGGIYLAASMLVLLITLAVDGGTLFRAMSGEAPIPDDPGQQPGFTLALMVGLLLSTPVMMAYWFAPLLTGWYRLPVAKALFFSLVACARNWRPFLGYTLHLLFFAAILPGVALGLVALISPTLAGLLAVPLPLAVLPIVFASFYANARDVFGELPDVPPR